MSGQWSAGRPPRLGEPGYTQYRRRRSRRGRVIDSNAMPLIDASVRKCVAFLCVENKQGKRVPVGSGFFIGVPLDDGGPGMRSQASPAPRAVYFVTARHVVEGARPRGVLFVRVNLRDAGTIDLSSDPDDWFTHPHTDIAIARVAVEPEYDVLTFPSEWLVTDDYIDQGGADRVGVGDEVFFAGLFSQFPGKKRSQPLIRFGQIALMPEEEISISIFPSDPDNRTPIDAYLVEARSWGGQSGSPAFCYSVFDDANPNFHNQKGPLIRSHMVRVLGVVHGHYDIPSMVKEPSGGGDNPTVDINAGIAIVVPAQAIIEMLALDELTEEREEMRKASEKNEPAPTPDLIPVPDEDEFGEFQSLTKKLLGVSKEELDSRNVTQSSHHT